MGTENAYAIILLLKRAAVKVAGLMHLCSGASIHQLPTMLSWCWQLFTPEAIRYADEAGLTARGRRQPRIGAALRLQEQVARSQTK